MIVPQKDLKVKEVSCTWYMGTHGVYLAAVQNLQLEHVISHPVTMVPLSLAPVDGAKTTEPANHL